MPPKRSSKPTDHVVVRVVSKASQVFCEEEKKESVEQVIEECVM